MDGVTRLYVQIGFYKSLLLLESIEQDRAARKWTSAHTEREKKSMARNDALS